MRKPKLISLALLIALPVLALTLGGYLGGLMVQFVALGLATASLAMCWGFAGILTLGHAVSFGIGAYAYAWVSLNLGESFQILGMIVAALLAGSFSAIVGVVGLRGQVDRVAFGLLTLVILYAAGQLVLAIPEITGGFNGLSGIRRFTLFGFEISSDASRTLLVLVAVITLLTLKKIMSGPFGGVLQLLRDSSIRSASFGYNVPAIRIFTFTAAGAIAGFAGTIFAAEVRFVSPSIIAVSMAVNFVVWALIGSRTSILGSFFTAVFFGFVTNELSDKLLNIWLLIIGLMFIGFVVFAPQGVVELVREKIPPKLRGTQKVVLKFKQSNYQKSETFEIHDLTVRFGGFTAVDKVSLTAEPGVIHVLIGPNGAGKSTLLNAVSGIIPGVSGHWSINEKTLTGKKPWKIARDGVGRKYQKPQLALDLTVAQHIALGAWGPNKSAWVLVLSKWEAFISEETFKFCEKSGLSEMFDRPVRELSHGQRQSLELAMVFAGSPKVLLLDEPAAGMTKSESLNFGELVLYIVKKTQIPILMVEHDMDLVRKISGQVTVLASGKSIGKGTVKMIEENPEVRALYLGDSAFLKSQESGDAQ